MMNTFQNSRMEESLDTDVHGVKRVEDRVLSAAEGASHRFDRMES